MDVYDKRATLLSLTSTTNSLPSKAQGCSPYPYRSDLYTEWTNLIIARPSERIPFNQVFLAPHGRDDGDGRASKKNPAYRGVFILLPAKSLWRYLV